MTLSRIAISKRSKATGAPMAPVFQMLAAVAVPWIPDFLYPEAKSVWSWVKNSVWIVAGYVVGFFVLLLFGWNPDASECASAGPRITHDQRVRHAVLAGPG